MRTTKPSKVAFLCLSLIAVIGAPVPATAGQPGSILISPVTDEGAPAEVSIQRPVRREAPATDESVTKTLTLLQADPMGAITILVESVELTGDTPTAGDNDYLGSTTPCRPSPHSATAPS